MRGAAYHEAFSSFPFLSRELVEVCLPKIFTDVRIRQILKVYPGPTQSFSESPRILIALPTSSQRVACFERLGAPVCLSAGSIEKLKSSEVLRLRTGFNHGTPSGTSLPIRLRARTAMCVQRLVIHSVNIASSRRICSPIM